MREGIFVGRAGGEFGDSVLGEGAFDKGGDVGGGIADVAEPVGHFEVVHEAGELVGEDIAGVFVFSAGYISAEDFGGFEVAFRAGAGGEPEYCGGVEDDRNAVGDDGVSCGFVSGGKKISDQTGNGVGHAVGQVDAGVTEADACVGGGEHHVAAGLVVGGVLKSAADVFGGKAETFEAPEIADGIGALVGGAKNGTVWTGAVTERDGGEGFDGVTEDVETGGRSDFAGHGAGVFGVDDAEGGLETTVGDAGLGAEGFVVEDGDAGGFAAGAGGGGDGEEGFEGSGDGFSFADGGIDVVEEVRRVTHVEVGGFGGVDGGAAADGDEGVELAGLGEGDGVLDGLIGGFDADTVVDGAGNVVVVERLEGGDYGVEMAEGRVNEDGYIVEAEFGEIGTDFSSSSDAEADGGGGHFKSVFMLHTPISLYRGGGPAGEGVFGAHCGLCSREVGCYHRF